MNLNKKISQFNLKSFSNKPIYFFSSMKSIKHIDHVSNELIIKKLVCEDSKQYVVVCSSHETLKTIKDRLQHPYFINTSELDTFISYCKKNNYYILLSDESYWFKIDPFAEIVETFTL